MPVSGNLIPGGELNACRPIGDPPDQLIVPSPRDSSSLPVAATGVSGATSGPRAWGVEALSPFAPSDV